MKKISIVLPTHNRLHRLKQVLEALVQQDYPINDYEVIVISDGSTDGTHEYLKGVETPYRLVARQTHNQGAGAARNLGIAEATGEIVLFVDDDVVPTPRFIAEHVDYHAKHEDVVVIGPMLTPPGFLLTPWVRWMHDRLVEQYESMTSGQWEPTARQFYTGNASVLRQHLVETGGFDPSYSRAEDVELGYRLAERGLRFLFNPRAIGYHYEERSYDAWASIPYAYGQNDVSFARDKGQNWLLPTVQKEFATRHPLQQMIARLVLGRPIMTRIALHGLRALSAVGAIGNSSALQRLAYSSIFNLRYYQGITAGVGGRYWLPSRGNHPGTARQATGGN